MLENFREKMRKMFECSPVKQKVNILIDLKEIQNKVIKKENFYFFLIVSVTFLLDRFTKNKIIGNYSDSAYYVTNFLKYIAWNIYLKKIL